MSSLPIPYTRQFNFTSFEASNPSKPKPGSSLDAEFNAAKQSLDATQSRLAEVQRDDGALRNGVVTRDSLDGDMGDAIDAVLGNVSAIDAQVAATTAAAAAAAVSEANAAGYVNAAQAQALAAQGQAGNAATSATAASTSAGQAATSASNAATSASAAASSAVDAAAAAQTAIPSGALMPYAGATEPNGWLLCAGQAVSRTVYAALFAAISTVYGAGDGSTTFNLPDLRGRAVAGKDNMGGTAANRLTLGGSGVIGTTLGAAGGFETHTLLAAQSGVPAHSHTASSSFSGGATNSAGAHTHTVPGGDPAGGVGLNPTYTANGTNMTATTASAGAHTHTVSGTVTTTVNNSTAANASAAHNNTQPTLVLNYIIKV